MTDVTIDRARLVEYIKANADQLVTHADVDVDTESVLVNGDAMHFATTVRIRIEGIPITDVEVQK